MHSVGTVRGAHGGESGSVGTDQQRVDRLAELLGYRSGKGEGFERRFGENAPVMFDDDEDTNAPTSCLLFPSDQRPSYFSSSITAGAAAAPSPRMIVSDTCSSGRLRRTMVWPPGAASDAVTSTASFLEAKRPRIVG